MTTYRAYVHLTSNEWGNELMRQIADEYAEQHAKRPLIVSVHEHGGWHLSYLYGAPGIQDGTICGTANDAASLPQAVLDFGNSVGTVEIIGDVRRELTTPMAGPPERDFPNRKRLSLTLE